MALFSKIYILKRKVFPSTWSVMMENISLITLLAKEDYE